MQRKQMKLRGNASKKFMKENKKEKKKTILKTQKTTYKMKRQSQRDISQELLVILKME